MNEYEFMIRCLLNEENSSINDVLERLGEAGCTDATIGIGVPGRIALNFTREAASERQAILSAVEDVKYAIPNAITIEIVPDLCGFCVAKA